MAKHETMQVNGNGNGHSSSEIVVETGEFRSLPLPLRLLIDTASEPFMSVNTRGKRFSHALRIFRRNEGHIYHDPDGIHTQRIEEHVPPVFHKMAAEGLSDRIFEGRKAVQEVQAKELPYPIRPIL